MKYLKIFQLNFNDAFEARSRSFVWFLLALINPVIATIFWRGALVEQKEVLPGWNLSSLATYYLLLILANTLLNVHIEEVVAKIDIYEGRLVNYLLRPFSYVWFKFFEELPYRLIQFVFSCIIFICFLVFFGRFAVLDLTLSQLILVIPILILALLLSFYFKMIVGISAFWFTDYMGLQELVFVMMLVFGGFVLPLELFPENLARFVYGLPFPYIIYFPIVALQGKLNPVNQLTVIVRQLFWLGLFIWVYRKLWKIGVKKFTGVGL